MRFGAMNFPVRPVMEELDAVARLGFDYLELTLDPPEAHFSRIRSQAEGIRQTLGARGMGLVCHMPTFVHIADLTESIRKASLGEVLSSLEVAAELEAEKIVLHPAFPSGLAVFVRELSRQYAGESLDVIVVRSRQLGLRLCLENMFPRCLTYFEPIHFKTVFDIYPDIQLTLDMGHANIDDPGGRRVLDFIRRFGDRIGHLHASDNLGKRDDHLSIGRGNIDFRKILSELKKAGYDETVTLEIFSTDRRELERGRERFADLLEAAP
jgi:sugar phosphate isomerase/epimerase